MACYEQSLEITREWGDSPEERLRQRHGEGQTIGNLGNVYDSQGRWQHENNKNKK